MMTAKPFYFDEIQLKAENRWHQLERDPELAAPWHLLFLQVQSPRHVISELLQNADDAEATEVSIKIADDLFTFDHNGQDFSADDFASLCRFGYSNKRSLHTIGFRGIGFKSTFSLGDTVGLRTPTLMVAFQKKRFTLPVWLNGEIAKDKNTRILVKIADEQRQKELLNNMQEWLNSPFSLLFFNHIRRVKLGDRDLNWKNLGTGPIPNSEWMGLQDHETPYLVARSLDEPFPDDALKEIREEHLLELAEKTSLPPCKVEIVLGAPGDLFVVLPTGVKTPLPFAINAPFVQDPARLKIKDPEISPTNRWLLQRIGQLAAVAMLQWLESKDLETNERARAYDLLPAPSNKDNSLENICARIVGEELINAIQGKPHVLTDAGNLEMAKRCYCIPPALWEVWTSNQIDSILRAKIKNSHLLSNEISSSNQQKLQRYNAVSSVDLDDFLNILTTQTPPRPKTWSSLLVLWNLASEWNSYYWKIGELGIHPVRGKRFLYSAKSVVRLGEKKLLQSEDDWGFLSDDLLVLDINWLRYLTEQRRIAAETNDEELGEKVDTADRLLQKNNLDEPSNMDVIIEQVATNFFAKDTQEPADCIRFTQIVAKLNVKTGSAFYFRTRDGVLRLVTEKIIFDENGKLEEFIPPEYREHLMLDERYTQTFISCSKKDWLRWIHSGNSGLMTYIPTTQTTVGIWSRKDLEDTVKARGFTGSLEYKYNHREYQIEDWDYPQEYWEYWGSCAQTDPAFWGGLVESLLRQPKVIEDSGTARALQIAKNRCYQYFPTGSLIPGWILKLRDVPCLRDTHGNYRRPIELMRRTPQTEPLLDVEPFVDAHLDNEAARPLLDLLGVRSSPTGPEQIIKRLRALAKSPKPPMLELTKWYQRLDALFDDCSTKDQEKIRSIFQNERLIFTEEGTWETVNSAYITANENDAPGAALIHSEASQLSLWRKINVSERPTVELALKWLKGFPSGEKLPPADTRRVKALLGRYPVRILQECRHWLNLAGEWMPAENLEFSLTMQSLIKWTNFHDWVKVETADLQMLRAEETREPPFDSWPSLASLMERRIEKPQKSGGRIDLAWLQVLGRIMIRINLDDDSLTARIRALAARLVETEGQRVETLNVIPYLDGKPAGLPENENLAWVDHILYMTDITKPRLIRQISETIAGVFNWSELKVILAYSFERSEQDIHAYLNENFSLDPEETTLSVEGWIGESEPKTKIPTIGLEEQTDETTSTVAPTQGYAEEELLDIPPQTVEPEIPPDKPKPPHPSKPPQIRIPLIERFALACGFHKDGSDHFTNSSGNILIKADGVFPWFIMEPGGSVLCYYWTKEHCLQTKPLELPTEIWHLIEENSHLHALILEDTDGHPIEMLGNDLLKLKEEGTLKLFPATYRLTLALED
jgi:hypothetical protein